MNITTISRLKHVERRLNSVLAMLDLTEDGEHDQTGVDKGEE